MIPVLFFPSWLHPTLIAIGPIAIRWYALAYIAGLVLGWRLARRLVQRPPVVATPVQVDDFLTWATLGVVIGGRLGYVLFYQPSRFLAAPAEIIAVWQGGMSFHGGALGVVVAILAFCRRNRLNAVAFADRIVTVVPIGLGFGRLANFINGELWGRAAPDWLPWAMVFPTGGDIPRHPSQLYQAVLEGLVLGLVMWRAAARPGTYARPGLATGLFLTLYGLARIVGELFREPDAFMGLFVADTVSMGQILSLPMVLAGLGLIAYASRRRRRRRVTAVAP